MNNNCKFTEHINHICSVAKQLSSWILRTFISREQIVMITLWKSLVLPKLDYCSQLWSPNTPGMIQKIEEIQRSYVRKIKGVSSKNYWERLKLLKLYSLQRRRERYQIIYIWKIIEGRVPNINAKCQAVNTSERLGRKCVIASSNNTLFRNSLPFYGARLFNVMPKSIRNITKTTVEVFKTSLDKYLSKIPDEPPVVGYTSLCANSNSLLDMVQHEEINNRRGVT